MIVSFSTFVQLTKMTATQNIEKILKRFLFISYFLLIFTNLSAKSNFLDGLSKNKVLPVDEAFIFEAVIQQKGIILSWSMKENCFLYNDKFEITTSPETNLSINTTGKTERINDIYFGDVDVFFNSVEKILILNPESKFINITYQGCNAQGFCYPPVNKQIEINKLINL